jgi:hypothetical protein
VQAPAAALLILVAVGLVAAWLHRSVAPPPAGEADRRGPVARAAATVEESVSQAAVSSLKTVARWLGLAATDRPTALPAVEPAEPPVVSGSGPPRRPAGRTLKPPSAGHGVGARAAASPALPDTTVYSTVDTEVVPAALLRARLPLNSRSGVRPEDLPEVELVVSPTGEVETVKLVTPTAGVLPAMMLSAIKAWRFEPATLDGQPVRYRLRMRLTNQ